MGQFIRLIGGKKYHITNSKRFGLKINILITQQARKTFKNEFKNWYHLFSDFDKL